VSRYKFAKWPTSFSGIVILLTAVEQLGYSPITDLAGKQKTKCKKCDKFIYFIGRVRAWRFGFFYFIIPWLGPEPWSGKQKLSLIYMLSRSIKVSDCYFFDQPQLTLNSVCSILTPKRLTLTARQYGEVVLPDDSTG
jgi:hypothetical protein